MKIITGSPRKNSAAPTAAWDARLQPYAAQASAPAFIAQGHAAYVVFRDAAIARVAALGIHLHGGPDGADRGGREWAKVSGELQGDVQDGLEGDSVDAQRTALRAVPDAIHHAHMFVSRERMGMELHNADALLDATVALLHSPDDDVRTLAHVVLARVHTVLAGYARESHVQTLVNEALARAT